MRRMRVMENVLKGIGTRVVVMVVIIKVKVKSVQESLRSKALSQLRSLRSKTTFTFEPEGVKPLIVTVLQNE